MRAVGSLSESKVEGGCGGRVGSMVATAFAEDPVGLPDQQTEGSHQVEEPCALRALTEWGD